MRLTDLFVWLDALAPDVDPLTRHTGLSVVLVILGLVLLVVLRERRLLRAQADTWTRAEAQERATNRALAELAARARRGDHVEDGRRRELDRAVQLGDYRRRRA